MIKSLYTFNVVQQWVKLSNKKYRYNKGDVSMKATIGNHITFSRFGFELYGTVQKIYDNSVLVELTENSFKHVMHEIPNEMTVVNHRNYSIVTPMETAV